jgi:cytochrome c-type biogenesis protein CcmE
MDMNEPFVNDDEIDGLDLTPRAAPAVAGSGDPQRTRRIAVIGVLALLVVALLFVAWQGLSNAAVFFRNVDEAVAQRDDLGTRRFRMQGSVVQGSVVDAVGEVRFAVSYGGVQAPVVHIGDPPELFQDDIPVVLEGHWSDDGTYFASDRILVKHSSEYEADNPDRVDDEASP